MNQRDRILFFDGRSLYRPHSVAECAFADAMANGEMGHFGREMPRHGQALTLVVNLRPWRYVMTHWSVAIPGKEHVHMKWYVLCFEGRAVDPDYIHRFTYDEQAKGEAIHDR